jgi:hypothetical protein
MKPISAAIMIFRCLPFFHCYSALGFPLRRLWAVPLICLMIPGIALSLELKISGDLLTVKAVNEPLRLILERLAEQGIRIRIDPNIDAQITADFENREIQKGLDALFGPYSHALIWEAVHGPLGSTPRLAEIRVYEPGKIRSVEPLETENALRISANPETGALFVSNEILLKPRPGMGLAAFQALLKKIGGRVVGGNRAVGIYRVRLENGTNVPALVAELKKHPGIDSVEPNYAYRIMSPHAGPPHAGTDTETSAAVIPAGSPPIAVLDTGLNPAAGLGELVVASLDALSPNQPLSDSLGHGTQMALVAAGIVKPLGTEESTSASSTVIPIRIFDENGMTSGFSIMESIEFAKKNGARVMSLSWGSDTRSEFLETALDAARSGGMFIVASAGNDPTGVPVYPAAYSSVIGVGALDPQGNFWQNSNHGEFVALYAPGFALMPVGYEGNAGLYAGTSIAAAYAANTIARLLAQNPGASLPEVVDALKNR